MNRVRDIKRRQNRANPQRAASTPRPGPPFGSSTPLFPRRTPLMELNGWPALDISTIQMEGDRRGRIQSENAPSIETFSEEAIGDPNVFQISTGNLRQYLSKIMEKKNKYKQIAIRARADLRQLTELTVEKFKEIEIGMEQLKVRQNLMFVAMSVCFILMFSFYWALLDATATTNGSPYL
ncbi:unnamed protein product [Oikopleura dioica]|uniref:Uncharacterized protein n=1 Tax=Oikopleura dioica TaxID=34765 RepID=E4YGY4_OIKDI|nr:unnamed protein product [Oikopleura dioica]